MAWLGCHCSSTAGMTATVVYSSWLGLAATAAALQE